MLRTRLIKDLDQMGTQAFPPPFGLMDLLEEAEVRGEAWCVLMAYGGPAGEVRWLVRFLDSGESLLFLEGEQVQGRWDAERQVFLPEEGPPIDLQGKPVSLSDREEAGEEDAMDEEEE